MGVAAVNVNAFRDLKTRIEALSRAGFRAELSQRLAAAAIKQVSDEFRESRDPYGKPWAPLVLRQGKPLRDTGRLAASVTAQPYAGGFRLSLPVSYAATHNFGATIRPKNGKYLKFAVKNRARGRRTTTAWYALKEVRIPRRQIVPEESTGGLGDRWLLAFNREAAKMLTEKARRR